MLLKQKVTYVFILFSTISILHCGDKGGGQPSVPVTAPVTLEEALPPQEPLPPPQLETILVSLGLDGGPTFLDVLQRVSADGNIVDFLAVPAAGQNPVALHRVILNNKTLEGHVVKSRSEGEGISAVVKFTGSAPNIFLRDSGGQEVNISVDPNGNPANAACRLPSISADGRFVVYESDASNLARETDTNKTSDIFLHDTQGGSTRRISVSSSGEEGNSFSRFAMISRDGGFVVFESFATNLAPGDTNGAPDIFVYDRINNTIERVSVGAQGEEANGVSVESDICDNGRFVVFASTATNLSPQDINAQGTDIFVRDRVNKKTRMVSVNSSGEQGLGETRVPLISQDCRFVVFHSSLATRGSEGDIFRVGPLF